MSEKNIYTAIKIFAVVGIILACYLLFEQFTQSPFRPCSISATINCDAVIIGAVSKTLGLPTPLYGLIGYIVILIAAVYRKKKLLLGTALFGLLFCLRIAIIELFQLKVICPVCILCQIDMIATFTLGVLLFFVKPKKTKKK